MAKMRMVDLEEGRIDVECDSPPLRSVKVEVIVTGLWAGFYLSRHEARRLAEALTEAADEADTMEARQR